MKNPTNMMTLTSSDGTSFELPVTTAALSEYVQQACSGGGGHGDHGEKTADKYGNGRIEWKGELSPPPRLDILFLSSGPLEKVVEFLLHYEAEPMHDISLPLQGRTFNEVVDQIWYQEFVSAAAMSREMDFEVMAGAHVMGIKPLVDLCCLKISFQVQGARSDDEIHVMFNIPPMSAEEEARAEEEYSGLSEENTNC